jgi:hypothetical protein
MRRGFIILAGICCCLLLAINYAGAALYTATQYQTEDAQDFTFLFYPIAISDGTDGTITIEAQGDYFGKDTENLSFNVEDAFYVYSVDPSAVTILDDTIFDNQQWLCTWTIPGDDLLAITSDTDGEVLVDLFTGVNYFSAYADTEYVKVTLEYNEVPVPSAVLLLGGGLIGLIGIRRKVRC